MKNKIKYIYSENIKTEKKDISQDYLTEVFNIKYYNVIFNVIQKDIN